MVNEDTIFKGEYISNLGLCILATASNSIYSAYPNDVQFDFYVGLKGTGKLVCFESVLEEDYSLVDEESIFEYFNGYLNEKTNIEKARKVAEEQLYKH